MKELFVSENDWDSHREALWVALENTKGLVVEFGCGYGSTPLLEKYCKAKGREFISVDTDEEWAKKFPVTHHVNDILEDFELPVETELLFIDSKPGEQRKYIIEAYQYLAKVIVVHDTEDGAEYVYGMKDVISKFKCRLKFTPQGKPHTTILTNFLSAIELWEDIT